MRATATLRWARRCGALILQQLWMPIPNFEASAEESSGNLIGEWRDVPVQDDSEKSGSYV
jgi:hypothetical protein